MGGFSHVDKNQEKKSLKILQNVKMGMREVLVFAKLRPHFCLKSIDSEVTFVVGETFAWNKKQPTGTKWVDKKMQYESRKPEIN